MYITYTIKQYDQPAEEFRTDFEWWIVTCQQV